jgi:hypothetical protein
MATSRANEVHRKFSACVIGHSYVRRLGDALSSEVKHKEELCRETPRLLRVDFQFERIEFFGHNGHLLSEMRQQVISAGRTRPDLVIINCGSNDLCEINCDLHVIAKGIFSYANFLIISFGVKCVNIIGVLRRDRCRHISAQDFHKRSFALNGLLKSMAATEAKIIFTQMRGFWRTEDGEQLAVTTWSDDGIHPGRSVNSRGFKKYRNNIRRALLNSATHLHNKF